MRSTPLSNSSSAAATEVGRAAAVRPRRRLRAGPTWGDALLVLLLVAAIPVAHRAVARPAAASSHLLLVESAEAPVQRLDARRDADVVLHGPLGETRLRIEGGEAWIAAAPCRNQLCRRMGRLSGPGRPLVCLPNRVLVRFVGEPTGLDGVTH